jgi:hypothetical protein
MSFQPEYPDWFKADAEGRYEDAYRLGERDAKHAKISVGEVNDLRAEIAELKARLDTPETDDWLEGVRLEAGHQIGRLGTSHDAGKSPFDWFWLIGYLSQKAADASVRGDVSKAKHHTISTGAALLNWHRALSARAT